jgi:hypothetical protein
MAAFVSDHRKCFDELIDRLTANEPVFVSRIGGSDTDAVVDYVRAKDLGATEFARHLAWHRPRVSRYNGFYDLTSSVETYTRYCEQLLQDYYASDTLFLCNHQLLSLYFGATLNPQFRRDQFENRADYTVLMESISVKVPNLRCYPYGFIERVVFEPHTMFWLLSVALQGRKVLVVSPFAESIVANFPNRHSFFKRGYAYPEFALSLVTSPITYAGLPPEMYPHDNWFSTVEQLRQEISGIDFDIALLSCGSYAMPLGVHIERVLRRKAIYIGGILQLYFGVMGRRYENAWFVDQINMDSFIYPLERERYMKFVNVHDGMAKEAFGAYF